MAKVFLIAMPISIVLPWITALFFYKLNSVRNIDESILLILIEYILGLGVVLGLPFTVVALTYDPSLTPPYPTGLGLYLSIASLIGLISWHNSKGQQSRKEDQD